MYIDRETPVREYIQSKTAQGVGGLPPKAKLVAERGRHGPGAENASRKVAKADSGGPSCWRSMTSCAPPRDPRACHCDPCRASPMKACNGAAISAVLMMRNMRGRTDLVLPPLGSFRYREHSGHVPQDGISAYGYSSRIVTGALYRMPNSGRSVTAFFTHPRSGP